MSDLRKKREKVGEKGKKGWGKGEKGAGYNQ